MCVYLIAHERRVSSEKRKSGPTSQWGGQSSLAKTSSDTGPWSMSRTMNSTEGAQTYQLLTWDVWWIPNVIVTYVFVNYVLKIEEYFVWVCRQFRTW